MRRPSFERWIRREILRLAGTTTFNFRALVARAQQTDAPELLAPSLLLYAIETESTARLLSLLWNERIRDEYESVMKNIGGRKIERLALRGTPMMTLPLSYRQIMETFADAYHAPERNAAEKQELWEEAHGIMLRFGLSPTTAARTLGLDAANVTSFMNNGDLGRLTVQRARQLADYFRNASGEMSAPEHGTGEPIAHLG